MDDGNEEEESYSEVSPVKPFKADQEVMVYDNEDDCRKAVVLKIDDNDFMVKMDGNTKFARNVVLIDSTLYKGNWIVCLKNL